MFNKGDYVICGNNGICQVEDITTLNIEDIDDSKKFYIMRPVFSNGSTVYKPVDNSDSIRYALDKKQAESLISEIPSIEGITDYEEKGLEKLYKELIRSNDPKALVQLIKTIYNRKEARMIKGFKQTALDSRYVKQAEDFLYGELSVALNMPKLQVKEFIHLQ